ncbi:hypothetical protein L6164_009719 [Bauhinia variegata]|uniref:Uncharacterized protein n=1 Tax=Bauhinia variegata TaxID=167791 RepID=A0ACB9PKL4_BAUVA|nr:hypothetical protein L6164_009719 [Bauhinia variegata]
MARKLLEFLLSLALLFSGGYSDVTFHFDNQCTYTIWRGSSPDMGDLDPEHPAGTYEIFYMDDKWSGSIWARTKCTSNATDYYSCETGNCGSGVIECKGPQPAYPVTLLNFNVNNPVVSYQVSEVHGQNIRVRLEPKGGTLVDGSGPCPVVDCARDFGDVCPPELVAANKNGVYVGCYSSCDKLKNCCNEAGCQPDYYTKRFKELCSNAHIYPADNNPPLYQCKGADSYDITFCPV